MSTQLFAVTGNPILHSKSPNMFNTQFKHSGIDAQYLYCVSETAENAIFLFRELGMKGMNVTSPFKEKIGAMLDVVHDEAKILGSVNTVVNQDGKLHGYNTDFYGVIQSFIDAEIQVKGKKCLVIGAGGAGKSAAYGLQSQGADVIIVNRTFNKARQAANIIGCKYSEFEEIPRLVGECEIIISALQQNVNPIQEEWLTEKHIVFDANYKGSILLESAKQKQCTIVSAEKWLLNQAVASYKLFFGTEPDKSIMQLGLSLPTLAQHSPIISTIGIMGAGKTTHGQLLAEELRYDFKDIDDEIVKQEGQSITEIFSQKGETYFRELEKEVLSKNCNSKKPSVLSCGGGIVLNEPNRILLKEKSLVIWLYATPNTIIQRINIAKRPLLQGENPKEKLESILRDRKDKYVQTAHVIYSTEASTKFHTADILKEEIERVWGQQ